MIRYVKWILTKLSNNTIMPFQKGDTPWNIGKSHSIETKRKISLATKGHTPWNKGKKNVYTPETLEAIRQARLGTKQSQETIERRVKKNIGQKRSKETRLKLRNGRLGKKHTEETKEKLSIFAKARFAIKGNHPFSGRQHTDIAKYKMSETRKKYWRRLGIVASDNSLRTSPQYKKWRNQILKIGLRVCLYCGSIDKPLEADHIKPWSLYPELRFDVNNGRILCIDCHKQTDTYGGRIHHGSQ